MDFPYEYRTFAGTDVRIEEQEGLAVAEFEGVPRESLISDGSL